SKTRLSGGVRETVNIVREEVWGASNRSRERKVGSEESGIAGGGRRSPGEGEREKSVRRDLVQIFRTMVEEVRDGARSVSRRGGGEEGGRLRMLVEGEREKSVRRALVQTGRTKWRPLRFPKGGRGGGWSADNVGRGGERKKCQVGPGSSMEGDERGGAAGCL